MQKLTKILFAIFLITLAACGGNNEEAALREKKAKLEELKGQQTKLNDEVTKLEADIIKLDPSSQKEEKAKLVTFEAISTHTFTHYIELQGKVEAVNISYVTPRGTGGQVKQLFVKKGDRVRKGQLLLRLDDAIARQSVVAAQQNLETLKTQLAFAQNIYQKQKNLWDQNIGTEVQLITAKNNADNVANQIRAMEAQIKISKQQLDFSNVYSDVDGVADDVNIRVGELFGGAGQIKIVNTSNLKITTQVPENYAGKVHVGSHVKVTLPDINKTIDATVSVVSNLIDANNHSYYVEVKIAADRAFQPNQIALVKIQDYSASNAITVPVNTLQTDDKGKYIMVAVKDKAKITAHKKRVTIGELSGDQIEIKSGLTTGDLLIVDGFQGLYEQQLLTTDAK
jgi:membrane fusion protein (multidrug efflux system)